MTKTDFVKNNRGINDGADLPEEFLHGIFDDILSNEIRMKDEVEAQVGANVPAGGPGIANALANVGRDLQKEAYVMQSNGMANRTEVSFALPHSVDDSELFLFAGLVQDHGEVATKGIEQWRPVFQRITLRSRAADV